MKLNEIHILANIDPTTLNTVVGIIGAIVGVIGIICTILGISSVTTAIKIKNQIKADSGSTVYQAQTIQQTIINESTNKEEMRSMFKDEIRSMIKEEIQRGTPLSPDDDLNKAATSFVPSSPPPKGITADSPGGNDELGTTSELSICP